MHTHNVSMTEGPIFRKIINYTIPLLLTGILQLFFNAADLVIVGQFGSSGSNAVAAVGCTASLTNFMINFFIGCSAGSGIAVAHAIGAKNTAAVHRTVHTVIPFAALGGTALSVIGFISSKPLLELMSTPDDILPLATVYMQIIFAGMLPNMVYNFGASVLRAAGDAKRPLYYLIIAGVINVILNLVFVWVFNMDVAGVALATVISQILSAVMVIVALTKRTDDYKLQLNKIRFYSEPLKKILRLGIPAGIQSSLFSISNVIIQSSINALEVVYVGIVAGNAAAQNVQSFAFATCEAYKQSAMNFAGQNVGAKRYDRVKKITYISLSSAAVTGIVIGILMTVFAEPLIKIYVTDSPDAVYWGVMRMVYICLPLFINSITDVATGVLRGMGMSVLPTFASVFGICVFRIIWIFTVFQIPEYHTPECLWISYVVSWVLTFALEYIILAISLNKKIKQQKEVQNDG